MTSVPVDSFQGIMIRGYCLEELLGHGTLTTVYRARSEDAWQPSEMLVIFFTLPEHISEEAMARFRERFFRVAERLSLLRHPNIFPLYGYGEYYSQRPYPYFFLQDAVGEVLKERMRKHRFWQPDEVLSLIEPIAAALDYLHAQGIVYQFLNPAHVLFPPGGDDSKLQLTGVALPHILSAHNIDLPLTNMCYPHLLRIGSTYQGDPAYIAPEVILEGKDDIRSDIYSLGILLFELLTGEPPFKGEAYLATLAQHLHAPLPSLREVRSALPLALEVVINRALHYKAEQRYQTASALVAAYRQAIEQRVKVAASRRLAHTIEKIRSLPTPTPLVTFQPVLSAGQVTSWPYTLLRELQTASSLPVSEPLPTALRPEEDDTKPLKTVGAKVHDTSLPREEQALFVSSQTLSVPTQFLTLVPSTPLPSSLRSDTEEQPVSGMDTAQRSSSQEDIAADISTSHPDMAQLAYQLRIIREQLQAQSQELHEALDIKYP